MLVDETLPQVATLLSDDARGLLAAALEPAGIEVLGARPSAVRYEPGRKIVVRYASRVRDSGQERVDTLVAMASRKELPEGVALLEGAEGAVGVWRYPNDPWLPGLRTLAYKEGTGAVLAQLGVRAGDLRIEPLVYRPGQRSVLRIVTERTVCYAKLVRPERAERLHRLHVLLREYVPVPRSLGWSGEHGLVLLEALAGDRLSERLGSGAPVPSPAALLGMLDRLADAAMPGEAPDVGSGPPGRQGFAHHVRLLCAIVPDAREIDALDEAARYELPANRTIHGDFYEGQVLARGREVAGLLDVDTVRAGHVVEDLATLLAHLDGLALVRPASAARIRAYRRGVERLAIERADRATVEAAVAGVMLGLATGPFRLQEPDWPARTLRWLQTARRALREGHGGRRGQAASREPRMSDLSSRRHGDLTTRRDSEGRTATTTRRRHT